MKRRFLPAAILALLAPFYVQAQEKIDDKIRVESDVVFGKGGGKDLKLDMAMPKDGNGPFPAIVCIHGGGWRMGNYKQHTNMTKEFAAKGYVSVTVQYRLTTEPQAQFPAQVEDVKCAVRWLRANAEKYRIDKQKIGAVGFSAGGHLSCMLGLTTREDGLEGDGGHSGESSQVQAVANYFGPTDFTKGDWEQNVQGLLVAFLGGTLEEKREAYTRASPLTYVRKDRAPAAFIFFHGTKDPLVSHTQSIRLHEALTKVGGSSQLVIMEGDGHGWGGEKMKKTMDQTIEFFDKNLKKKQG